MIDHTEAQELHELIGTTLLGLSDVDPEAALALERALEIVAIVVSDTGGEQAQFEARIAKDTGYGTLAHLFGVIVFDREVDFGMENHLLAERIAHHADMMWDSIIGPALDKLEDAVDDDIEES